MRRVGGGGGRAGRCGADLLLALVLVQKTTTSPVLQNKRALRRAFRVKTVPGQSIIIQRALVRREGAEVCKCEHRNGNHAIEKDVVLEEP